VPGEEPAVFDGVNWLGVVGEFFVVCMKKALHRLYNWMDDSGSGDRTSIRSRSTTSEVIDST
jgi:hypothetical protein